jgi:hypothetical protein
MAQAQADGISQRSLERAKAAQSVKSLRQGKHWAWTLPTMPAMPPGADPPGEPDTPPPPIATNAEFGPMPPGVALTIENGRYVYRV